MWIWKNGVDFNINFANLKFCASNCISVKRTRILDTKSKTAGGVNERMKFSLGEFFKNQLKRPGGQILPIAMEPPSSI